VKRHTSNAGQAQVDQTQQAAAKGSQRQHDQSPLLGAGLAPRILGFTTQRFQRIVVKRGIGAGLHGYTGGQQKLAGGKPPETGADDETAIGAYQRAGRHQQRGAPANAIGKITRRHFEQENRQVINRGQLDDLLQRQALAHVQEKHGNPGMTVGSGAKPGIQPYVELQACHYFCFDPPAG
jgi:hypothetical protein